MVKVRGANRLFRNKSKEKNTNESAKEHKKLNEEGCKSKNKKAHILKLSKPLGGVKNIISKKEKQKMKKQKLEKRVELTKAAFKEDKAKKVRQKTAVVGDMKPLLDSLPSLDELITLRDTSNKTGISSIDRRIPKEPRTKQERRQQMRHEKTEKMLDRFDHVQKIWRNPEFQRNPRKLIAEQIRKRREEANEKMNA